MSVLSCPHAAKWRKKLLLFLPLALAAGCNGGGPQTLPAQIVGVWKTDDARYHGRFLKLESDQITFGLGGIAPNQLEQIETVKMVPSDKATDYVIGLRAQDGTSDSVTLRFVPENGGELGIRNQAKVVWRRRSFPGATPPETPLRDGWPNEHKTVYKIDCLWPSLCRSY